MHDWSVELRMTIVRGTRIMVCMILLCTAWIPVSGQVPSRSFTIRDGLPSNLIYSLTQDNKGFLWIATDNGLARFDGKYFRIYNAGDGLPDNEILEVIRENDGTIWVNTFSRGPFYFDNLLNRFVDPLAGTRMDKKFIDLVIYVKALPEGGVVFYNSEGEFLFRNRNLVQGEVPRANSYLENGKIVDLRLSVLNLGKKHYYVHSRIDRQKDSMLLFKSDGSNPSTGMSFLDGNVLFVIGDGNAIHAVKRAGFSLGGDKFEVRTIHVPQQPVFLRTAGNRLNITSESGTIYVYSKDDLLRLYSVNNKFTFLNCVLEDREGNVWAGTLRRGLLMFRSGQMETISMPGVNLPASFISIAATPGGHLFAGNYFGEVYENSSGKVRRILPAGDERQMWIRRLLPAGGKMFLISENGCYADFKRPLNYNGSTLSRLKCATLLNDGMIITGGVGPTGGLFAINAFTEKVRKLNCPLVRISAIATLGGRYVYCGTNNGLFKYDYVRDTLLDPFIGTLMNSGRISVIHSTPDSLLFVGTASEGLFIIKNDRILARIGNNRLDQGELRCIYSVGANTLWIGTRSGLVKIVYELNGQDFTYSINHFSQAEGLPSDIVSDITSRSDSLFVATDNGIAYIPVDASVSSEPIPTYLSSIRINHESMPLTQDNRYELKNGSHSVSLEFSGVNLSGYLRKLQYAINRQDLWTDMEDNVLNLEFGHGAYQLWVRAVDRNGNTEGPVLPLYFHIDSPFYYSVWFFILATGIIAGIIVLGYYRIQWSRQRQAWLQQSRIEDERARITADLHDEIGSTLSSLQIYSDVAYNLADKNIGETKNLLRQITSKAAKVSDNIADIIWSLNARNKSALSPELRIKDIVSDTLGPTDIHFETQIDPDIGTEFTCIVCRKNLMLIIKEALNNILKYSRASFVKISLSRKAQYFVLIIQDDGKGMNLETRLGTGNGLSNMRKRSEEVGGRFEITSVESRGTEIIVKFPVPNSNGTCAHKK